MYSIEVGSTILSCLNLKIGEKKEYDFLEVAQKAHTDFEGNITLTENTEVFNSFLVMEDEIWVSGPSTLYHLDLESGEMNYYQLMNDEKYYGIEALYTDGKQLYATTCSLYETEKSFHRILTEEVEVDSMGNLILKVESLTK